LYSRGNVRLRNSLKSISPMKIRRFALAFCCLFPGLVLANSLPEASKLFRQGQHAQALDKVNGHLTGNAKDPQGRFLKGLILAEMNRTQDAIKTFTELTDDYPELPEPYNNLAVLYASQGQFERAKGSLEKAIRTHPSYATAHENLGDIYAKMASVAYDKALQLDKANASAQVKLSLVSDIFTPAPPGKARPTVKPGTLNAATLSGQASVTKDMLPPSPPARPTETPKAAAAGSPEKAVEDWANAWSRRDVEAYLAFYASDFQVPGNMSREDWEAQRKHRISRADSILVEVSDLSTSGDANKTTITFKQRYESNILKSTTRKTLTLRKQSGVWKIVSER
jgi:ketosteroid isomerase-like protein